MTKQESDNLKKEILLRELKNNAPSTPHTFGLHIAIMKAMESYHKQRVEAITDEMIEKFFPIDEQTKKDYPFYYSANLTKRDGVNWLKQTLLNNG